ncbi:TIGR03790 family protein [Paucibacter sp. TC2R-5]|uniref:TIGR03790 family protein n=1 Tax=Paucibacter sp. TC2R-5 TaxID=2893555 RepID=UPI0021E3D39B|nr:TIGR03790 family protein [Paucibacter sp. TC2R-5]MCV2359279.1 TIGR03790 family protein [Paucibacter sp. TC2R-5]
MAHLLLGAIVLAAFILAAPARAQEPTAAGPASAVASAAATAASGAPAPPAPVWLRVPRLQGRLTAAELGLVINTADPYSVAVGESYASQRGIPQANIARVVLPVKASLSLAEFTALQAQVQEKLGPQVQALALAWNLPYAVECNSITSALAMGFQPEICRNTCGPSKLSPYFSYVGARPFTDLGLRPAMMLASRSVEDAKALIARGVEADQSLPSFASSNAFFVSTPDAARNVRAVQFPPATRLAPWGVNVRRESSQALPAMQRTLLYTTGLVRVEGLASVDWLPGALADHLTSFGGRLDNDSTTGQMSALDWLQSGATASYGTVSEPCNHRQKFPHPQLLLLFYLQGVTALEAYWHSVAWPAQGVFVGEPLAAPFAAKFASP